MGDDFREVKCPDGSTRLVIKNLEKIPRIFGQYVPEWEFKLNAALKAVRQAATANAGTEIGKKAKKLYTEVDELNSRAISLFTMGYMQFTTNPCSNDQKLDDSTSKINQMIDRLSQIQLEIEKMNEPQLEGITEKVQLDTMDRIESEVQSMDGQLDNYMTQF